MNARERARGKGQAAKGLLFALALWPLIGLAGCASRGPEPLRLVLISPHRDEIREEVGRAFTVWFQERTTDRVAAARAALQAWLTAPADEPRRAAEHAFADVFQDWRADDQAEVRAAATTWREQPTGDHGRALLAALDRWQDRVPPVELVWQDIGGGTSQITRYVSARFEASPEGIGIDVLFGGGTEIYLRFAKQELLQEVTMPAAIMKRIRPQLNGVPLYDPGGRWYGPVLSSFGILYNREVLRRLHVPPPSFAGLTGQPPPESQGWAYLGQSELRGWVSAGDPRLTGSVHMVYEIILQGRGWDDGFRLLLRLGANTHSFIRDSGTLTRMVSTGEVAAAGNVDVNALSAVGREPALIGFELPPGETIINPDAIGVLKGAPHTELAQAFVEFTLSDAGQRLFMLRPGAPGGPRRYALCRLSVVEDLYQQYPPAERSVGDSNPFAVGDTLRAYNSELGNRRWDALNDLFGAVIVDAHPDLAAAWRAVLRRSPETRAALEEESFQPPCTEAELEAHARCIREDSPRARTETVNRWGEQARQHYRDVRRRAEE